MTRCEPTASQLFPGRPSAALPTCSVTEATIGLMEPNGLLVLTHRKEEQTASRGGIARLGARLTAMQASPELLAAFR